MPRVTIRIWDAGVDPDGPHSRGFAYEAPAPVTQSHLTSAGRIVWESARFASKVIASAEGAGSAVVLDSPDDEATAWGESSRRKSVEFMALADRLAQLAADAEVKAVHPWGYTNSGADFSVIVSTQHDNMRSADPFRVALRQAIKDSGAERFEPTDDEVLRFRGEASFLVDELLSARGESAARMVGDDLSGEEKEAGE